MQPSRVWQEVAKLGSGDGSADALVTCGKFIGLRDTAVGQRFRLVKKLQAVFTAKRRPSFIKDYSAEVKKLKDEPLL